MKRRYPPWFWDPGRVITRSLTQGVPEGPQKGRVFWDDENWTLGWGALWSEIWSTQIWSFLFMGGVGGGGALWSEIPERGFLEILDTNLLSVQQTASASQIVSHILRMWRLINEKKSLRLFIVQHVDSMCNIRLQCIRSLLSSLTWLPGYGVHVWATPMWNNYTIISCYRW